MSNDSWAVFELLFIHRVHGNTSVRAHSSTNASVSSQAEVPIPLSMNRQMDVSGFQGESETSDTFLYSGRDPGRVQDTVQVDCV